MCAVSAAGYAAAVSVQVHVFDQGHDRWLCVHDHLVSVHERLPDAITHAGGILARMVRPAEVLIHWSDGQFDNLGAI